MHTFDTKILPPFRQKIGITERKAEWTVAAGVRRKLAQIAWIQYPELLLKLTLVCEERGKTTDST